MAPQLIAREEAKAAILEYIKGVLSQEEYYWEPASRIKKCAILTTAGIKGTGKTRAALIVDFNGGSSWDHSKAGTEVFSKLLLQQSGMPADKAENCARVLPWKQVMQCLREKLNLGDEDLLLVGIDEIRQLETLAGKDGAVQLIFALMGAQDESLLQTSSCPVIFVWTSLLESYMSMLMRDSGRRILPPISLRGLPLAKALELLPSDLREALEKEPFGRQLVRQLLGHPRLMFDALIQEYTKHKDKPPRNPLAWNQLQSDIVAYAKLGDRKALDSIEVARWYSPLRSTTQSELEDLCLRGVVHSVRCGNSWINILHPILLQLWARSAETSLADQINQIFEQDAIMEATHEKKLEDIMVHFDCAVRLALGENNCTLKQLFPGASFWSERANIIVTCTQNVLAPLEYVESFADVEAVLESLKNGKIVVSTLRNEPGIEYLIPWMVPNQDDRRRIRDLNPPCNKTESASLLVLGIQTKCVGGNVPKWASVAKSAQEALAGFQNHPDVLGALPVFYTTEVKRLPGSEISDRDERILNSRIKDKAPASLRNVAFQFHLQACTVYSASSFRPWWPPGRGTQGGDELATSRNGHAPLRSLLGREASKDMGGKKKTLREIYRKLIEGLFANIAVIMAVACGVSVRQHLLVPLSRGFALPQFQLPGWVPSLKILSWNVAGLRSMLKRDDGAELFAVVKNEQPDITILQASTGSSATWQLLQFHRRKLCEEHKLQDVHVPKHEPSLLRIFDEACPGKRPYRAAWAVSSQRKGYSGTCAIYHSDAGGGVLSVTTGGVDKVDQSEGRSVCLSLSCGLRVVGVYVPNSGQSLSRLDYRVSEWDKNLRSYLAERKGSDSVLLCGDLNVAHEETERRLRHREVNKGLRLDYFLVSRALAKGTSQAALDDCRILDGYAGSDHCPIAVYAKWNAEKFSDVPRLMDKYKEQEDEIYDRIVRKYVFCRSQKDWQPLIEAMYRRFNPSKLQELDSIFAKYKDSEAALYRALCDKYLQTLSPDGEPLKFNVWELGTDPVEVGEASELEVLDSPQEEAPPIRLVSPSPSQPKDNQQKNGAEDVKKDREPSEARTSPHEEKQTGAAEELLAASLAALDAEGKEEKKKKKKRRDGEAFPPPLPRPPRESMAGVSDFPDVILGLTQAPAEKGPDKSRRANNSLRPKAAPRPPMTQPQEASSGQPEPPSDPVLGTTRKVRRKRAENGENVEASAPVEGRRKKRRKVAVRPGNGNATEVSKTAPAVQPVPTLEQRRLQLKEKLFELKTQISTQAVPKHGPPMLSPQRPRGPAEDFWGQPMKAPPGGAFDPDAYSYSYSEDDADFCAERQAESRTVVLRNKLEAQLRAKLMHTIHPKVPEAA
eukprot:s211_g32.t3